MAKKRVIALTTLAAGLAALYKIGEDELRRRADAATEEKDLEELLSDFEVADGEAKTFDYQEEPAEGEEDLEINESYDEETVVDMLSDAAAVIKVGLDVVTEKIKGSYEDYKEDPEAFKAKAKEFAKDKAEDARDFASDKYEYAKDFAAEKFEDVKGAAAEKFEEVKGVAAEKFEEAKGVAAEKVDLAKEMASAKVEIAKEFASEKIHGLKDFDLDEDLDFDDEPASVDKSELDDFEDYDLDIIDLGGKKEKKKDKKKK